MRAFIPKPAHRNKADVEYLHGLAIAVAERTYHTISRRPRTSMTPRAPLCIGSVVREYEAEETCLDERGCDTMSKRNVRLRNRMLSVTWRWVAEENDRSEVRYDTAVTGDVARLSCKRHEAVVMCRRSMVVLLRL